MHKAFKLIFKGDSMKKPVVLILIAFFVGLVLFNVFSTKVMFTDTAQYLGVAKEFAGISITKVRNTPGWLYGWVLGEILKVNESLLAVKLFNAMWLFFDAILLYFITRDKKALLLFVFSPIVWFMASWINPILMISFLLLSAYYLFKKYEENKKLSYFILSGLLLGLIPALWFAGVYLSIFFLFAFFYNKQLKYLIYYSIPFFATFSLRLILDYYYFSFPLYSLVRGFGSNMAYFLNITPESGAGFPYLEFLLIFLIISPFIYKIYKLNFKEYKSELIFLGLSVLVFIMNFQLRYFIILAPIFVLLIYKEISKKELFTHIAISLILIVLLTSPYFGETDDYLIMKDLKSIENDFPDEKFIAGGENLSEEEAFTLGTLYFGKNIKEFIWYSDYKFKDEDTQREYSFGSKSRIDNIRDIKINLIYERTEGNKDSDYLIMIGDGKVENFGLVKEYKILKVFKKKV